MEVKVTKLTDIDLMRKACSFTINAESKMSLEKIYKSGHSPMRAMMFSIEMYDIPTFVSVHLVRHNIGINHYVKTNREDRPGSYTGDLGRNQPVNHMCIVNAEAILNIAHKRLCSTTHKETKAVIEEWKKQIAKVDPDLARLMVPQCWYRNGYCPEFKPCGICKEYNA